jgi:predicted DNA-binding transcriptional regulator YafY
VVGAQAGSEGERAFRVDRIEALQVEDEAGAFDRPRGFDVGRALPEVPWEVGEDELRAVVRFDPSVAWWASRQLTDRATITEAADGGLEAVIPVAAIDPFLGWMIGFEDAAEIIAPPELRGRMVELIGGSP